MKSQPSSAATIIDSDRAGSRVTLRAVADRAGCSMPTVSKALNGRSGVSPEMRDLVLQTAREMGYSARPRPPRPADKRLSLTIAFENFGSLHSISLLSGALRAATKANLDLNVALLPARVNEKPVAEHWVRDQIECGHSGAILVVSHFAPELVEQATYHSFRLVSIDPLQPRDDSVATISATNWAGATAATEHLLGLGHSRIAFAGLDSTSAYSVERFAGFQSALERANIALNPSLVFEGDTRHESGLETAKQLLRLPELPTAVFCVCDALAFGLIQGVGAAGVKVPGDLSVVGFDDSIQAKWSQPALTTVRQPLQQMGALALKTLVSLAEGEEPASHHVQLATNLIVRGSTQAPRT